MRSVKARGKINTVKTYNPTDIEKKWQEKWEAEGVHKTPETPKNKKYILDMYPYPSGASLHVGHVEGYVGTDIIARYSRMKGYDVLHPMGWDSFGLPAENYAIKTGIHPEESTNKNIETFKRQLSAVGMSYDWDKEITSSDPNYYKWNQWLFTQLFKKGLAYKAASAVNWCPSCETVLANEQVEDGKCERCESIVELKNLDQWFFKITAYADRLISGLEEIDWLNEVKVQQKNWIGKKEGVEITYPVANSEAEITVFTTRPDTNFGATFVVVSPEYLKLDELVIEENQEAVQAYTEAAKAKTEEERMAEGRKKTGVFTGSYAVNHLTEEKMPIWVSDFVLAGFGTGAVVGVPGHDLRDFEFAKEFNLPIKRVVVGSNGDTSEITDEKQVQEEEGKMINSGFLDGLDIHEATAKIMDYIVEKGWGKKVTNLHLRDWLISRQRYWGTPIPMIYCQSCASAAKGEREGMPGWYAVPENELPVVLPKDVDFNPKGDSPIARSKSFQEGVICPGCGGEAKREVDTMDGYVDSSWYFIRFTDPKNQSEFASKEEMAKWLPVDVYVGGGHVVQHLLFARFFWKFMLDEGFIDKSLGEEPFLKLRAPGWILGPDSRKMSKRWGNVITPDDIIPKYGADTLRMYEMFMGPFEAMKPWSLTGVEGMSRFVKRVYALINDHFDADFKAERAKEMEALTHKTIKRVTVDIDDMRYNRAIAGIMEYVNGLTDMVGEWDENKQNEYQKIDEWHEAIKTLLLLLAPFAPHLTEELWQEYFGGEEYVSIHKQSWPKFDESKTIESSVNIPVQVNGKMRGSILIDSSETGNQEMIETEAKKLETVKRQMEGKSIQKVIYVKGRLINFVVS